MFSLICARISCWGNNGEAGDLRRHRVHYDVTVITDNTLVTQCSFHCEQDSHFWKNTTKRSGTRPVIFQVWAFNAVWNDCSSRTPWSDSDAMTNDKLQPYHRQNAETRELLTHSPLNQNSASSWLSQNAFLCVKRILKHYGDVIMSAMASQITSVSIVCSPACSGADQRKHHKGPVKRQFFSFDDVIMKYMHFSQLLSYIALCGVITDTSALFYLMNNGYIKW